MISDRIRIYVTAFHDEVTGSNNHVKVEFKDEREVAFVVDCGLFQEESHNHRNHDRLPFDASKISFAIATHVHTDHVGRFPCMAKMGFDGPVYASAETVELLPVVLNESYERLEDEHRLSMNRYAREKSTIRQKKLNSKGKGKKDKPRREKVKKEKVLKKPELLYEKVHVEKILGKTVAMPLKETFTPYDGIEITFYPNAHIAGAVLTVCRVFEGNEEIYLLFTGDVGMSNPVTGGKTELPSEVVNKIDYIICESTYGSSTESRNMEKQREKHMQIIKDTASKNGMIVYMSNSLERPLRLGVDLKLMQCDKNTANDMKNFKIFFDSTFGHKCLEKYVNLYGRDYLPENFIVVDKYSRARVLMEQGPKILICTSPRFYQGSFMNYGAKLLENSNVTMVFVAYVPPEVDNIIELQNGSTIKFMREDVVLRCKRQRFNYYSSHVSTEEMDNFLGQFWNIKAILFNHGTDESKNNYAKRYSGLCNQTHALMYGKTVVLDKNEIVKFF